MNIISKIKFRIQTALLSPRLKSAGKFTVCNPLRIVEPSCIEIGDQVFIRDQIWLEAIRAAEVSPSIIIDDRVYIGDFAHINAVRRIRIGAGCILANHVFITDHNHCFEDITIPIRQQGVEWMGDVEIGEETWIGERVSILGAKVGKRCVIGANSVVVKDIPDYSIALGSPAKVIKQFDFDKQEWIRVD